MTVSLSTLQKRARDKEYRLRKKGASEDEIKKFSPRVAATEISNMSSAQKRAYRRELEQFNSRANRLVPLQSGEIVEYSRIRAIDQMARQFNKKSAAERAALAELAKSAKVDYFKSAKRKSDTTQGSVDSLRTGREMKLPENKQKLARREKQIKALVETPAKEKRSRLRLQAVDALREIGMEDLARKVQNMRSDKFDLLMNYSDFWSLVSGIYARADIGDKTLTSGVTGSYANELSAIIAAARKA